MLYVTTFGARTANALQIKAWGWWTRTQRIRTAAKMPVEVKLSAINFGIATKIHLRQTGV